MPLGKQIPNCIKLKSRHPGYSTYHLITCGLFSYSEFPMAQTFKGINVYLIPARSWNLRRQPQALQPARPRPLLQATLQLHHLPPPVPPPGGNSSWLPAGGQPLYQLLGCTTLLFRVRSREVKNAVLSCVCYVSLV